MKNSKLILLGLLGLFDYLATHTYESIKEVTDTKMALLQFKNSDASFIMSHSYLQSNWLFVVLLLINILIICFIFGGGRKNEKSK
jgi:hypothetical protein